MKLGVLTVAALAAPAMFAQTSLTGSFVLAEEGVLASGAPFAALSKLTISSSGTVTGAQVAQGVIYDIQGVYTSGSDGVAVLDLTASAVSSDGEAILIPQSYRLVRQSQGRSVLVRTNPGIFAAGSLEAAAPVSTVTGTYYLSEEPAGRPAARLAVLTFDGTGTVSGYEIVNSVAANGKRDIKGSYQVNAAGFTAFSLSIASTGEDGEAISTTENYVMLATQTELTALRVDSGAARVINLEK